MVEEANDFSHRVESLRPMRVGAELGKHVVNGMLPAAETAPRGLPGDGWPVPARMAANEREISLPSPDDQRAITTGGDVPRLNRDATPGGRQADFA
jgi:hypothetical protein